MLKKRIAALLVACLPLVPAAVRAQAAANSVRVIVGSAPGGSIDYLGRLVAAEASKALNTPFWVDNKTGANGIIPAVEAARSPPDGRNFLVTTMGPLVNNIAVIRKLPYDPARDFTPVVTIARFPLAVFVRADGPYKSLKDLIVAAKAKPKALNFGTAGPANLTNLAAERLAESQKFQFTAVPYNSEASMMLAVAGGQVDATITTIAGGMALVQGGRVRVLAVLDTERFPALPDVPTTGELGIPNVEAAGIPVMVAPAGTPREAIDRVNGAVNQMLKRPEVVARLREMSIVPEGGSPEDMARMMKLEGERWLPLIRRLEIHD
jgi:tripartite-type tricarboxylate transporter receptor subunit TctC